MSQNSSAAILQRLCRAGNIKTDSALAKILNVSPQSVYDAKKKNRVPTAWAVTIAERFGVTVDWLLFGRGDMHALLMSHTHNFNPDRHLVNIPVIGMNAVENSSWCELSPLAMSVTLAPQSREAVVFAMPVIIKSLLPEGIKPGYVLIFDSFTPAEPGDIVFAKKNDGTGKMCKLACHDGDELSLLTWTEPDENGRQNEETEKVHLSKLAMLATAVMIKIKQ